MLVISEVYVITQNMLLTLVQSDKCDAGVDDEILGEKYEDYLDSVYETESDGK